MAARTEVVYWQHQSGDVYAVEIAHGGESNGYVSLLIGYCGPLNYREVTAANLEARDFDFEADPEQIEWMEGQPFRLLESDYPGDR